MGGRGASSGLEVNRRTGTPVVVPYGTKYHSFAQVDDIKFIIGNSDQINDTPMESMVAHRKYAVFTPDGYLKSIVFMDSKGMRFKQADFNHKHLEANPHVHIGYFHDEKGVRLALSRSEKTVYNKVKRYMKSLTKAELKEIFK